MTDIETKHAGILLSLVREFEEHRLPNLLKLRESVNNGEKLSDADLAFLAGVIDDAKRTMSLTFSHPELHEFCLHVVSLYNEISVGALANEG